MWILGDDAQAGYLLEVLVNDDGGKGFEAQHLDVGTARIYDLYFIFLLFAIELEVAHREIFFKLTEIIWLHRVVSAWYPDFQFEVGRGGQEYATLQMNN